MSQGITHIEVSLDPAQEQQLQATCFQRFDVNLNIDGPGHPIYIWYKNQCGAAPITRIQVTYDAIMCGGLINAGYSKVSLPGRNVVLWYFKGNTKYDTSIVNLAVTTNPEDEAEKVKSNWERAGGNLTKATGKWVYLWLKRQQPTYICDVTATDAFGTDTDLLNGGYIRVDDGTNTGVNGAMTYIWYRQTTDPKQALTELQISTTDDQYQECEKKGYKQVSVNLNEGTGGNTVYLWYKKEEKKAPTRSMLVLLNAGAKPIYEKAGITVINRNLNSGNSGPTLYLCVFSKM